LGSRQIHQVDKTPDHEDIFLRHNAWLLDRAVRLTNGSREEAEDLVQDLYLRFVLSKANVDLADDDRLRGYLFRILQNLSNDKHRNSARDPLTNLQTIDYDSMDSALHAVDRSGLLHVRSDLAGICEYTCIRRRTSRAGSVLILRYFLGYYPSEIVALLKSSPAAVHKLTETARLEAKAFLTRPDSLHFLGQDSRPTVSFAKRYLPDDPAVLYEELRRRIFAEAEGPCPAPDELHRIYTDNSESQLTMQEVAHLASCQACLERANRLINLPDLPTRFSDISHDRHDDNFSGPPRGTKSGSKARMRKKSRESYEHRPKSLEVAVNGEIRGAQEVTSAQSSFRIKLKPLASPKYIEVFSEQGICLLYLNLENHRSDEPAPSETEVHLSDERSLSLEITRSGNSPVVNISYFDPILAEGEESWAFEEELRYFTPLDKEKQPTDSSRQGRFHGLRNRLRPWFGELDLRWPLSVGATAGLATALAIGTLSLVRRNEQEATIPTAANLLAQSERSADLAIPPHGAARQTFFLEVRGEDGKLLESERVETLRSVTPQRRATRLINSMGKVLAGRWSDGEGKMAIYSIKDGFRRSLSSASSRITYADAWSHIPEAADFDQLSGQAAKLSVHREKDTYDLVYAETPHQPAASLISADLVLSASTMRPITETLRLREGEKTREYRFLEVSYEVLPATDVTESDFEPDATLVSLRPRLTTMQNGEESAHLALEALQLLNNLGPDVERIVNLERRTDGSVELDGVFPTSEQKASVVRVFRSLGGDGQLKMALHSSDEVVEPSKSLTNVSVGSLEPVAVDTQRIPFDFRLRSMLTSQGLNGPQLDERLRQISSDITNHSAQMHRESWSICQIAAHDFSIEELRKMKSEDQMLWVTLLDKHMRSFDQQVAALRAELTPLIHEERARLPGSSKTASSLQNAGELKQSATNLNQHSESLDRLLTAGFTLSPSGLPANDNFADIEPLMSNLDREEDMLRSTIEHLQTVGSADTNK
jgi:DNA-directed RNA polymerase specialized sigma24 family protein